MKLDRSQRRILAACLLLAPLMVCGAAASITDHKLFGRYFIGHPPPASEGCLEHSVFLVDTADRTVDLGDYVHFVAEGIERKGFFPDGTLMIKLVRGRAGDRVLIEDDRVTINGTHVGTVEINEFLENAPGDFDREVVIPEGHIWVMGTTPGSYDSRYWGPIPLSRVTGQGHALF